jgi:hypothetical protein
VPRGRDIHRLSRRRPSGDLPSLCECASLHALRLLWPAAEPRGKEIWDDALHRVRSFQDDSKQYVRANPTKAVFTALGVGLVLGLIMRR